MLLACGAAQLRLIYACNSPEDILMKKELDALAAGYYGKFKVRYGDVLDDVSVQGRESMTRPMASC